ncbi:hypothetical protein [Microbispora sp. H10949]|uniref:hypothetical protein n=1 Tax=Microbispora sp. H10949 TaxID=2729111 RepID=UPI001601DEF6|nr:hypothetical protein [Microbispora sp. H10949]
MKSHFFGSGRKALAIGLVALSVAIWLPPTSPGASATAKSTAQSAILSVEGTSVRDDPRPYHRVERQESEAQKKRVRERPDFGRADPITQAWSKHKMSVDDYIDLSLRRIARPDSLPEKYRPSGDLPPSTGLALGYALSLRDQASPATDEAIAKVKLSVLADAPSSTLPHTSLQAASWPECDAGDYNYLFHDFDCKRTLSLSRQVNIYYRVDGLKPLDGVPAVDTNGNGSPDAIDTFVNSLTAAWNAYESWGYGWPEDEVSIFFGFDENQNPGLTLPFGDSLEDGAIIVLPSDPGIQRYTYLAYHELFHVSQYAFLPLLQVIADLPSVNWWMEATAEWATHRMYTQVNATAPGWDIYSVALPLFLGDPENAVNASTWPWQEHKRQYGAFVLAQYLTEQTDTDFVRHTWEEIPLDDPISAIEQVVQGYGRYMPDLFQGFSLANYRLAVDSGDLSKFVGAAVGYRDAHAPGQWKSLLGSWNGRPKRAAERTMAWGDSADGSVQVYPGGTAYLEFTGPSSGQSRLTLQLAAQTLPRVDVRYLLVTWPTVGGVPSSIPSRWSRPDSTGRVSIALAPGETATLIATRTDVVGGSGSAADQMNAAPVGWTATMTDEGMAHPDAALDAMWTNRATSAHCADWSGGDAVQSTLLPSGKRAWFFSDTFLGDPAKRGTRDQTSYLRNSIVLQDGSALRTITGGSTCKETDPSTDFWSRYAKTPVGEGGQYWTGDAKVVSGSEVIKFYYQGIGDDDTRGAYASLRINDLEADNVLEVTPSNLQDCSARPPHPIIWGASLVDDDGYTYIYGWEGDGAHAEKSLFLARIPTGGSLDLVDQAYWRYYGGTASDGSARWVDSCSAAQPLQPKSEIDFSVIRLNGRFWLVYHTPASQAPGKIVAVPSATPWGFTTSNQVDLYTPPETQTNPRYSTVYGARVHQDILPDSGKVAISYTVSTSAANASCWTRGYYFPDNQYPRFVDVPVTAFFSPKVP